MESRDSGPVFPSRAWQFAVKPAFDRAEVAGSYGWDQKPSRQFESRRGLARSSVGHKGQMTGCRPPWPRAVQNLLEGWAENAARVPGKRHTFNTSRGRSGGAEGDRTPDLVIANDALSQLSYCPRPRRCFAQGGAIVKRGRGASQHFSSRRRVRPVQAGIGSIFLTKPTISVADRAPDDRATSRPL